MEICSVSKILPTLIISKCVQTRSTCPLPAAKNTLIFRVNLAVKTIKLQNNKKKCEQFYVSLAETFDMFYEKALFLHQLRTGIRTHRFCFLSHPSLPNKMIEPSKPRNALKLCFYFLLCISRTCQTSLPLFYLKSVHISRTCFVVC